MAYMIETRNVTVCDLWSLDDFTRANHLFFWVCNEHASVSFMSSLVAFGYS